MSTWRSCICFHNDLKGLLHKELSFWNEVYRWQWKCLSTTASVEIPIQCLWEEQDLFWLATSVIRMNVEDKWKQADRHKLPGCPGAAGISLGAKQTHLKFQVWLQQTLILMYLSEHLSIIISQSFIWKMVAAQSRLQEGPSSHIKLPFSGIWWLIVPCYPFIVQWIFCRVLVE